MPMPAIYTPGELVDPSIFYFLYFSHFALLPKFRFLLQPKHNWIDSLWTKPPRSPSTSYSNSRILLFWSFLPTTDWVTIFPFLVTFRVMLHFPCCIRLPYVALIHGIVLSIVGFYPLRL